MMAPPPSPVQPVAACAAPLRPQRWGLYAGPVPGNHEYKQAGWRCQPVSKAFLIHTIIHHCRTHVLRALRGTLGWNEPRQMKADTGYS